MLFFVPLGLLLCQIGLDVTNRCGILEAYLNLVAKRISDIDVPTCLHVTSSLDHRHEIIYFPSFIIVTKYKKYICKSNNKYKFHPLQVAIGCVFIKKYRIIMNT